MPRPWVSFEHTSGNSFCPHNPETNAILSSPHPPLPQQNPFPTYFSSYPKGDGSGAGPSDGAAEGDVSWGRVWLFCRFISGRGQLDYLL